jgi:hypothetical protein
MNIERKYVNAALLLPYVKNNAMVEVSPSRVDVMDDLDATSNAMANPAERSRHL